MEGGREGGSPGLLGEKVRHLNMNADEEEEGGRNRITDTLPSITWLSLSVSPISLRGFLFHLLWVFWWRRCESKMHVGWPVLGGGEVREDLGTFISNQILAPAQQKI